jgi:uncharacterized protein (DUF302 family)
MLLEVESKKTVAEIAQAFAEVCARHQFGLLGFYNLRQKLNEKGLPFDRECLVFEVCNPRQAQKVLEQNIAIATALPCRIAVYQEDGQTRLATIRPTALLSLFPNPELLPVAQEVESVLAQIMADLA